jgi:hypothetical protein
MAYQRVSFHIFEEDLVPGLTVVWLQTPEGLVPHTWRSAESGVVHDFRPASFHNREDTNRVDTEVYGGTMEQFCHSRETSRKFQEIHGREQGVYVHFPRSKRPAL